MHYSFNSEFTQCNLLMYEYMRMRRVMLRFSEPRWMKSAEKQIEIALKRCFGKKVGSIKFYYPKFDCQRLFVWLLARARVRFAVCFDVDRAIRHPVRTCTFFRYNKTYIIYFENLQWYFSNRAAVCSVSVLLCLLLGMRMNTIVTDFRSLMTNVRQINKWIDSWKCL